MNDDAVTQKRAEVDAIIEQLTEGDVALDEGRELKERGMALLDELAALVDQGDGETVVVRADDGELVEDELQV